MERTDRVVPLSHRVGSRRIYSGLAGARLSGAGREAHLSAGVIDGVGLPAGGAAAPATAPWTSGTLVRDVLDAAQNVRDGHVRICVSVVFDGRSFARNLARLPPRHRAAVANDHRVEALDLPADDPGFDQHQ